MYKVETHLHTSEGSGCAYSTAAEMVRSCIERGYYAAFVTDHFLNGNTTIPKELPWKEKIRLYFRGYENALKEAEGTGFKVFFGVEFTHIGADFLLYNITEEWLVAHENIMTETPEEFLTELRNSGVYVVHAHPYREAWYIPPIIKVYPGYVDAVEIYNAKNSPADANQNAEDFAAKYNYPGTGGSDAHNITEIVSGCDFDEPVDSVEDFIRQVKARSFTPIRKSQEGWS